LQPAPEVTVTPRGDADKPPAAAPVRAGGGKAEAETQGTKTHPDFQHLASVNVTAGGLGYKLAAVEGETGLALKKLPAPLTKQASFKVKMRPLASGRLITAFLAFGDSTADEQLVKCGFRVRMKKAFIVEGDLSSAKLAATPFACAADQTVEVEVTVDLASRKVKMTLPGTTLEATLERPLKAITHVGYCVNNSVTEFGAIETSGN
jgi:hypothetical protein